MIKITHWRSDSAAHSPCILFKVNLIVSKKKVFSIEFLHYFKQRFLPYFWRYFLHGLHISRRGGVKLFLRNCAPKGTKAAARVWRRRRRLANFFFLRLFLRRGWGGKARRCKKRPLLLLLLLSPVSHRQKMGGGGGRSMRFLRRIGASEAKRSREVPLPPSIYTWGRPKRCPCPRCGLEQNFANLFFPTAFLSLFIETSAAAPIFSCKVQCFQNCFIGSTI